MIRERKSHWSIRVRHAVLAARCALAVALVLGASVPARAAPATELPVLAVQATAVAQASRYDGQVEALRQAVVAAQVPGRVLELNVHAGDAVRAGQLLLRIDAQAAEQNAAASGAQVAAARAQLDVASTELARKRQLAQKSYISQAALEQAESQWRAAQAQVNALSAQAGAARTQTGLHVLRAPFDGVVAQLAVERGDMAMPGRPLLTVYDPAALRVTANVPASALKGGAAGAQVLLAGADSLLTPLRVQVLPTVDPQSLTQPVRADLPAGTRAVPGQFARLQLPGGAERSARPRVFIPASAVVRRAELTAVYVMGEGQRPQLRQVRLGPVQGAQIEVLAGLDAGESLITDPQAATRAVANGSR
ncbi:efflux RND transporter periplasmic adaptor subunit [Ottowia pentelensis]|uniref:Efflux RND transporter periplasmic adaptor subunit n=1 Tax=Ottowia pentelensis TaxID=511108 RepID=A0ABV6PVB4_9BURK